MVLENSLYPVHYLGRLYAVGDDTWNVGDEMSAEVWILFGFLVGTAGVLMYLAYFDD